MSYSIPTAALSKIQLMGDIFQGAGQIISGFEENRQQKYNAQIAEQNAAAVRERQKLQEWQQRKELKAIIGTQIATYARNGVAFTGSPIVVMADTIANAELDIAIGAYNSHIEASRYQSEADLRRYYGKQAIFKGVTKGSQTLLAATTKYKESQKIPEKTKTGE